MTQGDEDSVEESKAPDPNLVDTGDSGETTNPQGDVGCGSIAQAVTKSQHGDNNTQDWGLEVLNHALVHILDEDEVDTGAIEDFAAFVIGNGIDNVHFLLTVSEDDFKSMSYNIDFKMFCFLQVLNKMHIVKGSPRQSNFSREASSQPLNQSQRKCHC